MADLGLTGANLDDAESLIFNHPGHQGRIVPPPPDPKADPRTRRRPAASAKKGGTPAPNKFKVTVAADVPPGNYDVRAVGKEGVEQPADVRRRRPAGGASRRSRTTTSPRR